MSDALLRTDGVTRRFGGLVAVDQAALSLRPAEIHAVIGPNGAGKSTLLSMLAGELRPSAGRVFLRDRDITRASVEQRTRFGIGRTYQRSAIIPQVTALDMVRLAAFRRHAPGLALLRPAGRLPAATASARQALARVGLAERESIATDVLSHGEKRRLEIAAVLALEPDILLLDEPLAGLGPEEARDIAALIQSLRDRCAVMLIEHDIDVVFAVADRITVLDNGRVIASGIPDEIRADVAVQQAYLGAPQ